MLLVAISLRVLGYGIGYRNIFFFVVFAVATNGVGSTSCAAFSCYHYSLLLLVLLLLLLLLVLLLLRLLYNNIRWQLNSTVRHTEFERERERDGDGEYETKFETGTENPLMSRLASLLSFW